MPVTNGLIILTQPVSVLRTQIPRLLDHVASVISDTVYIHLQPALESSASLHNCLLSPLACTTEMQSFISDMYGLHSSRCQNLDIRVLLAHVTNKMQPSVPNYKLSKPLTVLLSDAPFMQELWKSDRASLVEVLQKTFSEGINDRLTVEQLLMGQSGDSSAVRATEKRSDKLRTYDHVVVGGTFDHMHAGHSILLSQTCLICDKELTVGVTTEAMTGKKVLKELIAPHEERAAQVVKFISDVKPNIIIDPVYISDPYGPTAHRADLQCLVVSQETIKGSVLINEERKRQCLPPMDVVTVNLVEDACHAPEEEEKVSSSSQRRRMLGTLLRRPVPKQPQVPLRPYRIGLTGGIASGKSNLCRELKELGATVIDCDKLGHKAYQPGTEGFSAVVKEFGQDIVTDAGDIDRKKLGAIVFSDKTKLEKLNSIVWPIIMNLVEEEIKTLSPEFPRSSQPQEGAMVVALEAAVLLEAGWDKSVHEVWSTFVPREEAIQRIVKRDHLKEEQAALRVDAQLSNKERIAKSNVVVCSLWDFDNTRRQIQKAWNLLQQRVPPSSPL